MVPYVEHAILALQTINDAPGFVPGMPFPSNGFNPVILGPLVIVLTALAGAWIGNRLQVSRALDLAQSAYPKAEVDSRIQTACAVVDDKADRAQATADAAAREADMARTSTAALAGQFGLFKDQILATGATRADLQATEERIWSRVERMHSENQKAIADMAKANAQGIAGLSGRIDMLLARRQDAA